MKNLSDDSESDILVPLRLYRRLSPANCYINRHIRVEILRRSGEFLWELLQGSTPAGPAAAVQPCLGPSRNEGADSKAALPKGGTIEEGRPHCPPTEFSPQSPLLSICALCYWRTPATSRSAISSSESWSISLHTYSVCSPRRGAGERSFPGVFDSLNGGPS